MPDQLPCPHCRAILALPDTAVGHPVQCPRCQATIVANGPSAGMVGAVRAGAPWPAVAGVSTWPVAPQGERRARAAIDLIVWCLVVNVGAGGVGWLRFNMNQELLRNPLLVSQDRRWLLAVVGTPIQVVDFLARVAAGVAFLRWVHRAVKNLEGLRAERREFGPTGAVVIFFIPVLNLYWPYLAIQELWKASHPDAVATPTQWKSRCKGAAIQNWWVAWVTAGVLGLFAVGMRQSQDPVRRVEADLLELVARAIDLLAGLLVIYVIRQIMTRQTRRYLRLCEAGPPGR